MRDRKQVQRQREQQQMAKLMQSDKPRDGHRRPAIITTRSKHPDLDITPEERDRRGTAADAMFQEFKRKIARGEPPGDP